MGHRAIGQTNQIFQDIRRTLLQIFAFWIDACDWHQKRKRYDTQKYQVCEELVKSVQDRNSTPRSVPGARGQRTTNPAGAAG